jgi:hypothetical protein
MMDMEKSKQMQNLFAVLNERKFFTIETENLKGQLIKMIGREFITHNGEIVTDEVDANLHLLKLIDFDMKPGDRYWSPDVRKSSMCSEFIFGNDPWFDEEMLVRGLIFKNEWDARSVGVNTAIVVSKLLKERFEFSYKDSEFYKESELYKNVVMDDLETVGSGEFKK